MSSLWLVAYDLMFMFGWCLLQVCFAVVDFLSLF